MLLSARTTRGAAGTAISGAVLSFAGAVLSSAGAVLSGADLTGIRQPLVDLKNRCGAAPAPMTP